MRGIFVLIRHGSNLNIKKVIEIIPDILRLDVSNGVNNLTIFGVYGTSRYDDEQFFINLRTHILEAENTEIIILGDLNISLDKNRYLRGNTTNTHWRSRSVVQEWIESGDFTDAYRSLNPEGKQMTWKNLTEPRRLGWTTSYSPTAWQEN